MGERFSPQPDGESAASKMGPRRSGRLKKAAAFAAAAMATGLGGQRAEAIGKNEKAILGGLLGAKAAEVLGKKKSERAERRSRQETERLNESVKWPDLKGKRVLVRYPTEIQETNFAFDSEIEAQFVDALEVELKALGAELVIQRAGVNRVSEERREERDNPDVKQATVAKTGTIERADLILEPKVMLLDSRRSQDAFYLGWGGRFSFGDAGYTSKTSRVGISATLRDESQKNLGTLRAPGVEYDVDSIRIFAGVGYYSNRDDDRGRQLRALESATGNVLGAIGKAVQPEAKAKPMGEARAKKE